MAAVDRMRRLVGRTPGEVSVCTPQQQVAAVRTCVSDRPRRVRTALLLCSQHGRAPCRVGELFTEGLLRHGAEPMQFKLITVADMWCCCCDSCVARTAIVNGATCRCYMYLAVQACMRQSSTKVGRHSAGHAVTHQMMNDPSVLHGRLHRAWRHATKLLLTRYPPWSILMLVPYGLCTANTCSLLWLAGICPDRPLSCAHGCVCGFVQFLPAARWQAAMQAGCNDILGPERIYAKVRHFLLTVIRSCVSSTCAAHAGGQHYSWCNRGLALLP